MAHFNISELANQGRDSNNNLIPVMQFPPLAVQDLAIAASSAQSLAFQPQTSCLRLTCDINCAYAISSNPTATTTSTWLAAGQIEYVQVAPGQSLKIAVIQA